MVEPQIHQQMYHTTELTVNQMMDVLVKVTANLRISSSYNIEDTSLPPYKR
jgi:hypothetical protein